MVDDRGQERVAHGEALVDPLHSDLDQGAVVVDGDRRASELVDVDRELLTMIEQVLAQQPPDRLLEIVRLARLSESQRGPGERIFPAASGNQRMREKEGRESPASRIETRVLLRDVERRQRLTRRGRGRRGESVDGKGRVSNREIGVLELLGGEGRCGRPHLARERARDQSAEQGGKRESGGATDL